VQVANILGGRAVDRGHLVIFARYMPVISEKVMQDLLWGNTKTKHQEKEPSKKLTYVTV